MPKVVISKELLKRLRAFEKVVDCVLEQSLQNESAYAELVLSLGMDKMFEDLLPKDEQGLLQKTIIAMFQENPEFVTNFVVSTMKRGAEVQKEKELFQKHIQKE